MPQLLGLSVGVVKIVFRSVHGSQKQHLAAPCAFYAISGMLKEEQGIPLQVMEFSMQHVAASTSLVWWNAAHVQFGQYKASKVDKQADSQETLVYHIIQIQQVLIISPYQSGCPDNDLFCRPCQMAPFGPLSNCPQGSSPFMSLFRKLTQAEFLLWFTSRPDSLAAWKQGGSPKKVPGGCS